MPVPKRTVTVTKTSVISVTADDVAGILCLHFGLPNGVVEFDIDFLGETLEGASLTTVETSEQENPFDG